MIRALSILEATIGGTRTHLRQLVENLDRRRFELTVACSTKRDPHFQNDLSSFRERGVRVHEVPMRREIHPAADVAALIRLCGVIRRGDFTIVHTHSSKAGALGRIAAALCSRAKIVHTPHTFAFTYDGEFSPGQRSLFLLLERSLGRITDRLIAVSSEERELALRHRIAPPSRIALQFNGVGGGVPDRERGRRLLHDLGVDPETPLIGTAGLITPAKGHRHLISALATILRDHPRLRCLIIGDGDSLAELRRQAAREGVAPATVFAGHVESCADLLTMLDVFVLPSLREGMSYALLEAMAAGIPVVATRVGGCKDAVVDGETGLLVEAADPGMLGAAISRLLGNPDERARMGENGRQRVGEHFSLDRMIAGLERIYEELASG